VVVDGDAAASMTQAVVDEMPLESELPRGAPSDAPFAMGTASIWRRVRRDAVLLGGGSVGIVVAQLGFRAILVVALVPAAYGRLSLILSLYNTVFLVGASGLPNSVARYISVSSPTEDAGIIRSAIRAGAWPTVIAAGVIAVVSGVLLKSPIACLFAAVGLSSLVYSLITTGILRGRGKVVEAAAIQPIAAIAEVAPLAALWLSGVRVTPVSAFAVFCLGNVVGLVAGGYCTYRTTPKDVDGSATENVLGAVPSARELLGFSMWLGLATVGVAVMPLVMRFAAAFDSYSVVATVDVALVLLSIPQRVGTVIVQAVIPHATRALGNNDVTLTISRREHLFMIVPFVIVASIVAFTPVVGTVFGLLGRPGYAKGAEYLALALLAGPARILYGLVQGILVAHGDGRFLAHNSLSITAVASVLIFAFAALGSTVAAFGVFVVACWAVYLVGLARVHSFGSGAQPQLSGGE
jgi:O-antigen/teichoic acid export membrane protein